MLRETNVNERMNKATPWQTHFQGGGGPRHAERCAGDRQGCSGRQGSAHGTRLRWDGTAEPPVWSQSSSSWGGWLSGLRWVGLERMSLAFPGGWRGGMALGLDILLLSLEP